MHLGPKVVTPTAATTPLGGGTEEIGQWLQNEHWKVHSCLAVWCVGDTHLALGEELRGLRSMSGVTTPAHEGQSVSLRMFAEAINTVQPPQKRSHPSIQQKKELSFRGCCLGFSAPPALFWATGQFYHAGVETPPAPLVPSVPVRSPVSRSPRSDANFRASFRPPREPGPRNQSRAAD